MHGDYQLGNLVLDTSEPSIVVVLGWELSTLGESLVDFVYHCPT